MLCYVVCSVMLHYIMVWYGMVYVTLCHYRHVFLFQKKPQLLITILNTVNERICRKPEYFYDKTQKGSG